MEEFPLHLLEPHPQALMCAAAADADERAAADAAVAASVAVDGVMVPLALADRAGGGYWVIDGCSRLAAAEAAGLESVPGEVLYLADEREIGEEIYRRNALRKPFTSSQRVMLWVVLHLGEILENYNPKAGRKKIVTSCDNFSARGIADKIGVNYTDVAAAIELCRCENARLVPDAHTGELRAADGDEGGRLDAVYAAVLHGGTPVRRWKAAFAGMGVTDGGPGAVNYVNLGLRTVKSLRTVFAGWQNIRPAERGPVLDILWEALESAPDDVLALIENRIGKGK